MTREYPHENTTQEVHILIFGLTLESTGGENVDLDVGKARFGNTPWRSAGRGRAPSQVSTKDKASSAMTQDFLTFISFQMNLFCIAAGINLKGNFREWDHRVK